jgi:hypothetical protein
MSRQSISPEGLGLEFLLEYLSVAQNSKNFRKISRNIFVQIRENRRYSRDDFACLASFSAKV